MSVKTILGSFIHMKDRHAMGSIFCRKGTLHITSMCDGGPRSGGGCLLVPVCTAPPHQRLRLPEGHQTLGQAVGHISSGHAVTPQLVTPQLVTRQLVTMSRLRWSDDPGGSDGEGWRGTRPRYSREAREGAGRWGEASSSSSSYTASCSSSWRHAQARPRQHWRQQEAAEPPRHELYPDHGAARHYG